MKPHYESTPNKREKEKETLTFQSRAKRINVYLKEQNEPLNFKGYSETVYHYFKLQEQDLYSVYQSMIECNLWNNYFADVENFIQLKHLEIQLEVDRLKAHVDKRIPNEPLELDIKALSKKAKEFTLFHKQVMAQRIFFEKAFWHCYKVYGKGINTLTYKTFDD